MFIWDIAPWMRNTTAQLNLIQNSLDGIVANQAAMIDLLMQLKPKDLSPEQQQMINEIYEMAVATQARIKAATPSK